MALDEGNFLSWYNDEISRYRDHEWQLTSYSIGLSSAVVLFAKDADTSKLIHPCMAALAIVVLVAVLIVAEFHTHSRLNQYRQRRTLLLTLQDHRAERIEGRFLMDAFDGLYFCSFVLFPALFGLAAARVLLT